MVNVGINALVNCLATQRNQALDALADNAAEIATLRQRVQELETQWGDLAAVTIRFSELTNKEH